MNSAQILLIIKNSSQSGLYHEFFTLNGYTVYLCNDLASALVQLLMFEINIIILGTDFSSRAIKKFIFLLDYRFDTQKQEVLIIDTVDKGNPLKNFNSSRRIQYLQSIDPQKILEVISTLHPGS